MPNTSRKTRAAAHAGSWYNKNGTELNAQLDKFLANVTPSQDQESYPIQGCKAIIAPHAGYSYSGQAAAWAYKSIDPTPIKRVFILGPSHHYHLDACALPRAETVEYATPIGNLALDIDTLQELRATGKFEILEFDADEEEHSLEMHLPYVFKIFGKDIKIVPILVGGIDRDVESTYGALLAPYLARADTFCVTSSDFCHWGTRFSYTYYYPEPAPSTATGLRLSRHTSQPTAGFPIHASISRLDHEAMDILCVPPATAADAHAHFAEYLGKTRNTICGRHPIGVLLGAMAALEEEKRPVLKWVRYEQSSECYTLEDSSVSYASAWIRY